MTSRSRRRLMIGVVGALVLLPLVAVGADDGAPPFDDHRTTTVCGEFPVVEACETAATTDPATGAVSLRNTVRTGADGDLPGWGSNAWVDGYLGLTHPVTGGMHGLRIDVVVAVDDVVATVDTSLLSGLAIMTVGVRVSGDGCDCEAITRTELLRLSEPGAVSTGAIDVPLELVVTDAGGGPIDGAFDIEVFFWSDTYLDPGAAGSTSVAFDASATTVSVVAS